MSKSAQKILHTAESLFNAQSFVAVGVDLIRDASGCSKTTLYTHFKNKQQLVESVLQHRDQRYRNSLIESMGTLQGLAALEAIFDWHIQWFQSDHFKGCLFVRAVGESQQDNPAIHSISLAHKQWLYHLIHQQLQQLSQSTTMTELFYTHLEGLISRFMLEAFDQALIQQHKHLVFKLLHILQANTE